MYIIIELSMKLVTSHIWLESLGYGNKLVAKPKFRIFSRSCPRELKIGPKYKKI